MKHCAKILTFGFLIILIACSQDNNNGKNKVLIVKDDFSDRVDSITTTYFPDTLSMDSLYIIWYSRQLFAMEEPSLIENQNAMIEKYRFTYLPSFSMPIAIRLEKNIDDTIVNLYAKSHLGTGGYPPKDKGLDMKRLLPIYDYYNCWDSLQSKINKLDFWNQKFDVEWNHGRCDGTMFIIEGYSKGTYQIIHRWSPDPDSFEKVKEFKELCDYFFELKDIGFDKIYWGGKWIEE